MTSQPWHDISRASLRPTPCAGDATTSAPHLIGTCAERVQLGPCDVPSCEVDLARPPRAPILSDRRAAPRDVPDERSRPRRLRVTSRAASRGAAAPSPTPGTARMAGPCPVPPPILHAVVHAISTSRGVRSPRPTRLASAPPECREPNPPVSSLV